MNTLLDGIRQGIGIQYARFAFRKEREAVISFSSAIHNAHRAILIMPLRRQQFFPTIMVMDFLKSRFREEDITLLCDGFGREELKMLPRSTFIRILEDEVNPFFVPGKSLIERLSRHPYDLAIDLNLDFLLPSAYICRATKAAVRIGFGHKHADTFYNFQIQPDPALERSQLYDRMARLLHGF